MDDEEFAWMVARLEAEAANCPLAFRTKVILISCAAYVAMVLALAVYVALAAGGLYLVANHGSLFAKFAVAAFALGGIPVIYGFAHAVLMRLPPPQGRPLARAEAPVLFDLLDKMRRKLKGPPIHHVLVNDDYNASVCQMSRFGLVGPSTNYLILGLPFLLGTSTSETMATVAHEYGHLCGEHGKLGGWIYRQRIALGRVSDNVQAMREDSFWHGAVASLLDRFAPYYNAYTFVLARQDEYDADRTASRMAGAGAMASMLVRATLQGRWYAEKFWPAVYRQADLRERPAFMPYQAMDTTFRLAHSEWASPAMLADELKQVSGVADTHPCLRDRIDALGIQAALPAALKTSAAASLLGGSAKTLVAEFDQGWWKGVEKDWGTRYRHAGRSRLRLEELGAAPMAALALHDLQELAMLKQEFESPQAAKAPLEFLMRQAGGPFPKAEFTYGQILLGEGNRAGLDYLKTAARCDRRLADDALRTGHAFICGKHGEEAAHAWVDAVLQPA